MTESQKASRKRYLLHFECCGNEVPLGRDRRVGNHGDFCLACETDNPETEVRAR